MKKERDDTHPAPPHKSRQHNTCLKSGPDCDDDAAQMRTDPKIPTPQQAATRRARERLDFLSAASAQLVETLDYETMLQNVAGLAVPHIADWCAVYIVQPSQRIKAVAIAHRDPEGLALARRVVPRFPVELDDPSGAGHVIHTGKTEFIAVVPDDPQSEQSSEAPKIGRTPNVKLHSSITAPLTARGVTHGAITIANSTSGRTFTSDDVELVTELANRAALAIENARLYGQAQEARKRAEESEARSALLAAFSETLAASLDYAQTLPRAVQLLVPSQAEWALIDLATKDGVQRVVSIHKDSALNDSLSLAPPPPLCANESARLFAEVDGAKIASLVGAETYALLNAPQTGCVISLPLGVREGLQGRMLFGRGKGCETLTESDLEFGRQLAARAAIAVDNARLYQQATDAIRVRDNLLSIASHELKTPLTSMNLSIDLLRRLAVKATDEQLRAQVGKRVESVWQQLQWLQSLVDELLDVTQIDNGRLDLQRECGDLTAIAREVAERFSSEFEQAGCALRIDSQGDATGRWDRARLEQVVVNLLTNAIKYGGRRPVEVRVKGCDNAVMLVVTDGGIGLAASELDRIFDPFERTDAARNFSGLGLGLYITRHIVESHGGTVSCESEGPGKGATFTVKLPRQ